MEQIILKAEKIHKSFLNGDEKLKVLKGLNFYLKEKEIISIMGDSGCGKSTALNILGTLDKADSGDLTFKGKKVDQLDNQKLSKVRNQEIGFVFQFHQLLPEFSVIENICIPAFIKKTSKKDAELKATELIDYLGLSERKHNKPSELSGGEKQRVAVARALINSPSLILADEPSGNLDSSTSNNLHDLFNELRKDFKYTFVIATHDISLAKKSDRILKISDGIIK